MVGRPLVGHVLKLRSYKVVMVVMVSGICGPKLANRCPKP